MQSDQTLQIGVNPRFGHGLRSRPVGGADRGYQLTVARDNVCRIQRQGIGVGAVGRRQPPQLIDLGLEAHLGAGESYRVMRRPPR